MASFTNVAWLRDVHDIFGTHRSPPVSGLADQWLGGAGVAGGASLGETRSATASPTASIVKVLAAYVALVQS